MSAVPTDFENQFTHSDLPTTGFLLTLRGLPGSSSDAYLPPSLPLRAGVGRDEAARKHSSRGGWEVVPLWGRWRGWCSHGRYRAAPEALLVEGGHRASCRGHKRDGGAASP